MLDFAALLGKEISLTELIAGLVNRDLHILCDEMVDKVLDLLEGASNFDITFVPVDPDAQDNYAASEAEVNLPWTLGHVIVHLNASSEEGAAQSASLARGVPLTGRSRYEVSWETVTTVYQLDDLLEDSRRVQHAYLSAWPNPPNLKLTYTSSYPGAKPRNAVAYYISSLAHAYSHLEQIQKILAQSRAAALEAHQQ